MNKHSVIYGIIALTLFSLVSLYPSPVSADWLLDRSGTLIKIDPRILGDDDSREIMADDDAGEADEIEVEDEDKPESNSRSSREEVKSSSGNPVTQNSELQKKEQERAREITQKNAELARKASEKAKAELKRKIEINELKSKTGKIERESEIEVEGNTLKIKQKIKTADGRETETETQMENGEELQVESKTGDESKKFKLRARQDDRLEVEKDGVKIGTKLPISISKDNELVVTRPDGTTKIVAVMPDQALKMLKEQNITPEDTLADASGDATGLPELEEEDGESVYKIDGKKQEKILGLFKIAYKTKAVVSAETGELIRTELSGLDRFMSLFSF